MKTFKVFEKGIETIIEADNIVTMRNGDARIYKGGVLVASLNSGVSWIEIGDDGQSKKDGEENQ